MNLARVRDSTERISESHKQLKQSLDLDVPKGGKVDGRTNTGDRRQATGDGGQNSGDSDRGVSLG